MIFKLRLTQLDFTVLPFLLEINKKRGTHEMENTTIDHTTNNIDKELQKKLKMEPCEKQRTKVFLNILLTCEFSVLEKVFGFTRALR